MYKKVSHVLSLWIYKNLLFIYIFKRFKYQNMLK